MKRLDVVLIHPASRSRVYQNLGQELAAIEPPVWTRMLASYCQTRGLSVIIIDAEAENLTAAQVAERVDDLNPTLAAVVVYGHQPSASTQTMTAAGDVCRAIKLSMPEQQVLLVGGHVGALPKRTLREEQADFVASGEGFHTIVALVQALQSAVPLFSKVPGLGYRDDDGHACTNLDAPLIVDLQQEVPGTACWDLLPMTKYRAHNWQCLGGKSRQPYASIYTTLGCPYHCSFCCIQAPFRAGERSAGLPSSRNSYRYWSPASVLAQIDVLVNRYGVRNIKIADEMFVLNRKHVLDICAGISERKYDLNLWAYGRVDTIKEGVLESMRAAGFTWLALGIEAGADNVRAGVDKAFHQDEVFDVVQRLRGAGIHTIGNFIFGLPEDDANTMQATLDLAEELNCEFANFYATMAYPGSPLYTRALQDDVPLPRTWAGYSQHARDCLPLPTRHLTAPDVLQLRDDAFDRYYTNPRYLDMIGQRFGPATIQHLQRMTSIRLERDLLTGKLDVPLVKLPTEKRLALSAE